MSYAKEATVSIKDHTGLSVGSRVLFSDFYKTNYCGLTAFTDKLGEVVEIKKRTVSAEHLKEDKECYRMFVSRYGVLPSYDIVALHIKFEGSEIVYLASVFGVKAA